MLTSYWPLAASALASWLGWWLLTNVLPTFRALSKFPEANRVPGLFSDAKSKAKFRAEGSQLIFDAAKKYDGPFQVLTDTGPNIVLPPKYLDEIKSDPRMDFDEVNRHEFFADYPGFDGFKEATGPNGFVLEAVRVKLTQNLAKMTVGLSEEMKDVLDSKWTKSGEWHSLFLRQAVLDIVSRLSVLVFLGPELCRNQEWLDISVNHTISAVTAANVLRSWPAITRPIVHWFLPECRALRAEVEKARSLLQPVIERRQAAGRDAKEHNDLIQWMEDVANGRPYYALSAQLGLGFAATHTTSDLLAQVIMDLCQHPELIGPLREEISTVLREHGWEKTSLYKMRLLDSVLKESQRLKPPGSSKYLLQRTYSAVKLTRHQVSMRRLPLEQVTLKDGTVLPKGVPICITTTSFRDPAVYENPDQFDGARYLKMREVAGNESVGQFVSTSPIHYGFGHGKHACPGRFFAANEVKIALAHILLKYDVELVPGRAPQTWSRGFELAADPTQTIRVRRRADAPEI